MLETLDHRKQTFDFWKMYCTVCTFLQCKTSCLRSTKHSKGGLFHTPHRILIWDQKKGSQSPPKGSSKAFGSTRKTFPKLDTKKSDFLRWSPTGGNAVFEPWTLETGPQLYIDIHDELGLKTHRIQTLFPMSWSLTSGNSWYQNHSKIDSRCWSFPRFVFNKFLLTKPRSMYFPETQNP